MPASSMPLVATIAHDGSSNFAVWLKDLNGQNIDLLVNEIGSYAGTSEISVANHDQVKGGAILVIEADGNWSVDMHPLIDQPVWTPSAPISGVGAQVLVVPGGVNAPTRVSISSDGSGNFAVWTTSTGGIFPRDLLVNEIGAYNGVHLISKGTFVVTIQADPGSNWVITPA
ncbi:MAG: hypothetical protein GEV08_02575 [Acidimicrobiia bacterium]|nr:hypothetical protein [Acidimicrobiia bacterium]